MSAASDLSPQAESVYADIVNALQPSITYPAWNPAHTCYGDCYWAERLGMPGSAIRPIVNALQQRGLIVCTEAPRYAANRMYYYRLGINHGAEEVHDVATR